MSDSDATHPYEMSISLNVLNHLGIGLYSNVPAVLSEVVANAWDADATKVTISIDPTAGRIVVTDDGIGMTKADINGKYLNVGYQKRTSQPGPTAKGRDPMGRKGIGKLSVFSIAKTVDVYSVKDGECNALSMNSDKITEQIERDEKGKYYPDVIDDLSPIDFARGTKLILHDLKKSVTTTSRFLRTRLARRFSIIGAKRDFHVVIDGEEVGAEDRDYYDKIEFLWHIGDVPDDFLQKGKDGNVVVDGTGVSTLLPKIRKSFPVSGIVDAANRYTATGWIGTVDKQESIDEENNTIVVLAHGKLIQEDVLKDLKEAGIYSKYLIGEINADFMDADDQADIVTSARQSVKEDDARYETLKKFIQSILKSIQNRWTDLRNEVSLDRALEHPGVKSWYDRLGGDKRHYARQVFGKIESLKSLDNEAKKELYKQSLLAFERLAFKESLHILDTIDTPEEFETLAKLFGQIDELEAVYYHEIAKGRIEIVRQFERVLPNAKERLIQRHIFDHLWLLDPSWERAASHQRIEESVTAEFEKIDAKLTDEEKAGRIDIRYRTAAGKHIIIELKKYDRKVTVEELFVQVRKYRDALDKCLRTKFPNETRVIETICVLGSPPEPHDLDHEQENIDVLRRVGARYITYDTLIQQSLQSYQDYLEKSKHISELIAMIDSLDQTFDQVSGPPSKSVA
jgi:hypothetical protein